MKHYSVKPIRLVLRPSRRLALLLGAAGAGSCLLLALLPLPAGAKLLLAGMAVPFALFHIARDALLCLPGSVQALEVTGQGVLRFQPRSGAWVEAEVGGRSCVTPWLTVLNLRLPGQRRERHVILLPDSGDRDLLRRLRVWLRWGSQAASADA